MFLSDFTTYLMRQFGYKAFALGLTESKQFKCISHFFLPLASPLKFYPWSQHEIGIMVNWCQIQLFQKHMTGKTKGSGLISNDCTSKSSSTPQTSGISYSLPLVSLLP